MVLYLSVDRPSSATHQTKNKTANWQILLISMHQKIHKYFQLQIIAQLSPEESAPVSLSIHFNISA